MRTTKKSTLSTVVQNHGRLAALLKIASKVAAAVVPPICLTLLLQRLSGEALWMPPAWRLAVEIFGAITGLIAFGLARRLYPVHRVASEGHATADGPVPPHQLDYAVQSGIENAESSDDEQAHARKLRWAAACLVMSIMCFIILMLLRGACLVGMNGRDWQYYEEQVEKARPIAEDGPAVPDFINLKTNQVYVPL